jgi:hypothetical protein
MQSNLCHQHSVHWSNLSERQHLERVELQKLQQQQKQHLQQHEEEQRQELQLLLEEEAQREKVLGRERQREDEWSNECQKDLDTLQQQHILADEELLQYHRHQHQHQQKGWEELLVLECQEAFAVYCAMQRQANLRREAEVCRDVLEVMEGMLDALVP